MRLKSTHTLEEKERRTCQDIKREVRGTHKLERVERGTCQDITKSYVIETHSLPGEHRGRNKSLYKKKVSRWQALTIWRAQRGKSGHQIKSSKGHRNSHSKGCRVKGQLQVTEMK